MLSDFKEPAEALEDQLGSVDCARKSEELCLAKTYLL